MIKNIEEFYSQKLENITFIELKPNANVTISDSKLKTNIPYPMLMNNLISEIKEKRAQDEIKLELLIEGMIYTVAVDPKFKYVKDYIDELVHIYKDIEKYLLYKGFGYLKDEKIDDALIYFKAITVINPDNAKGLYNYSLTLEKVAVNKLKYNKNKEAKIFLRESTSILEDILDIDSEFELTYYKLGFHYKHAKQFKKADIVWEKFLDMSKDQDLIEEIQTNLNAIKDDVDYEEGYNYVLMGYPQKGLEILLELKEKYTDWWNLLFMIGLAYRQLNDYSSAIKEFENVIAINPKQLDTLNELAMCYAAVGSLDSAIEKINLAIAIKPDDAELLCNRGMILLNFGKIKEAETDILKAYEINPNDEVNITCKKQLESLVK
ncbi:tetratricopeptide repeat protein [Abyssisolibacter fermentans]|uniref:tetratricopeptide repeat protein n=1 Tax=Abyssisolibacter fermentans TaxID=1766203 RepID=UPI000835192B|nr:tetratricopeptide repeat protein [Abyssisolibacter fermentans]